MKGGEYGELQATCQEGLVEYFGGVDYFTALF
jgi:hypothetical protein